MELPIHSLSPTTKKALEVFAKANNFGELKSVEGPGKLGPHRVAREVADALTELASRMRTPSSEGFSNQEMKMMDRLFCRLASNDINLQDVLTEVMGHLFSEIPSAAEQVDVARLSQSIKQLTVVAREYQVRLNMAQLSKPQARALSETAPLWLGALRDSEYSGLSPATRASITPIPTGDTSATGSCVLVGPATVQSSVSSSSSSPASASTKKLAIAKSANTGTGNIDNREPFPSLIKMWGLLPGQEVQGEHLSAFLQALLGLPTNVPDTVAMVLVHRAFGSANPDLIALDGGRGSPDSIRDCLNLLAQSADRETFQMDLVNRQYLKDADAIISALSSRTISFADTEAARHDISEVMKSERTEKEFYEWLITYIQPAGVLTEPRELSVDALSDIFGFTAERMLQPGRLTLAQNIGIAGRIYDTLTSIAPSNQAYFCSVQAWMDGCVDMPHLTNDQLKEVIPLVYGRAALLDFMTAQRDRNPGNLMFSRVTAADKVASIEAQVPGLGEWVLETARAEFLTAATAASIGRQAEVDIVNHVAETLLSQWETMHGESLPRSMMQLEWDVHLLVNMCYRGITETLDVVPIDNGISFPDPSLGADVRMSCFENKTHNAWLRQPQARIGRLPRRTAEHLARMDMRQQVIPKVTAETANLERLAVGAPGAVVSFNEEQQKLWLLSTRILQIGAEMSKSFFEMGLMKDSLNETNLETPLIRLHRTYCEGTLLEKIDMDGLSSAIRAEYQNLTSTIAAIPSSIEDEDLKTLRTLLGVS